MRRYPAPTFLSLAVFCFLGLAAAQDLAGFDEAGARLAYEANTVEVAARYGASAVGVRVVAPPQPQNAGASPASGATLRSGSGFLVRLSGRPYFITSYHVLKAAAQEDERAVKLEVTFSATDKSPTTVPVRVKHVLPEWDLALLEPLEAGKVPDVSPIPLGASNSLRLGQKVIVIGSPFGLDSTVTIGVVSALNRRLPGSFPPMIQTDAAINHGSSGGPLLTARGEAVGVATAIYNPIGDTFAGVSLAVPLQPLLDSLAGLALYPEPVQRTTPELTVLDVRELPRSVHVLFGLPEEGSLVLSVEPGSAAAQAGLRGGSRPVVYGSSQWLVGGDVIVAVKEVGLDTSAQPPADRSTESVRLCDVTVVRGGYRVSLLVPQTVLAGPDASACSELTVP